MIKKYPFIKQDGLKDCGICCMQMIISFYKGYIGTEKLRDMTKTNKLGTNAYNIVETFKELGFESKGVKCDLDMITKDNLILPCIASVTINKSYKHYIVIYEINFNKKNLLIADPAGKIKKISFNEFNEIWNNVLIISYPIKSIPFEKDIKFFDLFINLFNINKKMFINIIIISFFITFFSIINSFYFQLILNNYLKEKNIIFLIFISFILINLLKHISNYFRNTLLIYINQKVDLILNMDVFKKIILLPYAFYRNRTTGEIVSRISDLSLVKDMISRVTLSLFVDLPLTLISLICLFCINVNLAIIAIIMFFLYLSSLIIYTPIIKKQANDCQKEKANVSSYMVEVISGFETIKGLSLEEDVYEKCTSKHINLLNKVFKFDKNLNRKMIISDFIENISMLVIIYVGILLVLDNKLNIYSLITFNSLFIYFLNPIKNIFDMLTDYNSGKIALKRVFEIIISDENNGFIKNDINKIQFKNLTYSYDNSKNILKNINLTIDSNQKIMIVGDSGSGKSTLLKLLMKYYKVSRNSLYLNDIDINDYDSNCIKSNICYISQNEILFNDTLYNNITLNKKISDDDFVSVTKLCEVDKIIKNDNLGFNLLIEENGFNLSGGEKQRIILSRSLLRPFNILIIDEGLNEIDNNLERRILKRLFKKYKDKIIIVISHRLDNIDLYDRILEFSNSRLIRDYRYE